MEKLFSSHQVNQTIKEPFPDQQIMVNFKRRHDVESSRAIANMLYQLDTRSKRPNKL